MNDAELKIAALVAARYAAHEFRKYESWRFYEEEFAPMLLADPTFVCTAKYTFTLVNKAYRGSRKMEGYVDVTGARGPAAVAGRIMGEWLGGTTTIDQEMWQW